MDTKTCSRCWQEKSIDEFYRAKKNGKLLNSYIVWCKSCLRENGRIYRESKEGKRHAAEYRKSDARKEVLARYNVSEKRKEVTRRYMQTDKYLAQVEKRESDPMWPKIKNARYAARRAMLDGRIPRGECEYLHLGNCHGRMEMHHGNYDKPLEVRWLCSRHHKFVNKKTLP